MVGRRAPGVRSRLGSRQHRRIDMGDDLAEHPRNHRRPVDRANLRRIVDRLRTSGGLRSLDDGTDRRRMAVLRMEPRRRSRLRADVLGATRRPQRRRPNRPGRSRSVRRLPHRTRPTARWRLPRLRPGRRRGRRSGRLRGDRARLGRLFSDALRPQTDRPLRAGKHRSFILDTPPNEASSTALFC